jgi:hypothetical protein
MPTDQPDDYQAEKCRSVVALESNVISRDLGTLSDNLTDQIICSRCHVLFQSEGALMAHLRDDHDPVDLDQKEGDCQALAEQQIKLDEVMDRLLGRNDDTLYRQAGLNMAMEEIALSVHIELDECQEADSDA